MDSKFIEAARRCAGIPKYFDEPCAGCPLEHEDEPCVQLFVKAIAEDSEQYRPVSNSCIDHPAHYQGEYECIDLMREIFGDEAVRHFCICNAYKYRFRAGNKQGAAANDDIAKAEWYERYVMEKIPQNYAAWADRRNKYNTCKEDRSEKDAE